METEELPAEIVSDPALLFLYRRAEQSMGIRAAPESLAKLKFYLERRHGGYVEAPAAWDRAFSSPEELAEAARLLTINETYFFREEAHFTLLLRYFLPRFAAYDRPVRVCSAASSSGCEAWSIAMVMDYYSRGRSLAANSPGESGAALSWNVDAFDINRDVIDMARKGRYTAHAFREDGRNFNRIGDSYLSREADEFVVAESLRGKVRFFAHNIMDGIEGKYDLIFFRNALIYFSPGSRMKILDILAHALTDTGCLIPGVSETAVVEHPLLTSRYTMGAFFFQNVRAADGGFRQESPHRGTSAVPDQSAVEVPDRAGRRSSSVSVAEPEKAALPRRGGVGRSTPPDMQAVASLLIEDEGRPNALKVLSLLAESRAERSLPHELAAAAVSLLATGDRAYADQVISAFEAESSSAAAHFLRGEYHYLAEQYGEAETAFQDAAGRDRAFWPALYRLSSLAQEGNRTRYEYRIKKALESLNRGGELLYEIFIGGFSPDYYRHILENRLASCSPLESRSPAKGRTEREEG